MPMRALAARLGLAAVDSLGTRRDGSFADKIAAARDELPTVARGRRRSRRHPLHLRHHRALEGRDADPRQSRLQRAGAGRAVALQRRRRADPRAAGLPYPRPVRRRQCRAGRRRDDDLPAALRRRRGRRRAAARDDADGRADLLHPAARPSRPDARGEPRTCACSSAARRRCSPRPTRAGARRPATPCSSATA